MTEASWRAFSRTSLGRFGVLAEEPVRVSGLRGGLGSGCRGRDHGRIGVVGTNEQARGEQTARSQQDTPDVCPNGHDELPSQHTGLRVKKQRGTKGDLRSIRVRGRETGTTGCERRLRQAESLLAVGGDAGEGPGRIEDDFDIGFADAGQFEEFALHLRRDLGGQRKTGNVSVIFTSMRASGVPSTG